MTDEEKENRSRNLEEMVNSVGGRILLEHINDEIIAGWDKFIALPVDKKTSKAAYDAQANYKVLKEFRDWIYSEIKLGKQI